MSEVWRTCAVSGPAWLFAMRASALSVDPTQPISSGEFEAVPDEAGMR